MRLLSCIVTYNRLEYTKRCIESYLETVTVPHFLMVVDNGSTDGTREWLRTNVGADHVTFTDRNFYPGAACNKVWHYGTKYESSTGFPTHLHRSDNDIEYLPGWDTHAAEVFEAFDDLGELGLLNQDTEDISVQETTRNGVSVNTAWATIGGNAIIPRKLYDEGLRWEPGPWRPGANEDALLSMEVKRRGYMVANMIPRLAVNMAYGRYTDYPEYYNETAAARGLVAETSV